MTTGTSGAPQRVRAGLALTASTACLAPTGLALALLALVVLAQVLGARELQHDDLRAWSGLFAMILYAGVGIVGWGLLAAAGLFCHTAGLLLAAWARRLGARTLALALALAHGGMLLVDLAWLGVLASFAIGLADTAARP